MKKLHDSVLAFRPDLTPKQMLLLGVFCGDYFSPAERAEFPKSWFSRAKIAGEAGHDCSLNYFGVHASQSREEWERRGWISVHDPLGWFQWYCRYYLGRRIPDEDARQIKRWCAMSRHIAQIKKHCVPGDESCRPRQRQALFHWAIDSRRL